MSGICNNINKPWGSVDHTNDSDKGLLEALMVRGERRAWGGWGASGKEVTTTGEVIERENGETRGKDKNELN